MRKTKLLCQFLSLPNRGLLPTQEAAIFFGNSIQTKPNRIYSEEVLSIIFSLGRLSLFEKYKGRFKDVIVFLPFYNHADHKQHFASLGLGSHWGSTGGHWSPASLTLLHLPNQPNFNLTLHPG